MGEKRDLGQRACRRALCAPPPLRLDHDASAGHVIVDDRSGTRYRVRLPAEPEWYSWTTSREIPMSRIGVMQGTYLGIYINLVCTFWNYSPPLNCRFCTTGQNVGATEARDKAVPDVVETCRAARDYSGVTFVHLNGGFQGSRGSPWPSRTSGRSRRTSGCWSACNSRRRRTSAGTTG